VTFKKGDLQVLETSCLPGYGRLTSPTGALTFPGLLEGFTQEAVFVNYQNSHDAAG